MFIPITPVELTGITADGAWHDMDCAAYIPSTATGVILRHVATMGNNRNVDFRKYGSTDDHYSAQTLGTTTYHGLRIVGVSNYIFQYKFYSATTHNLYLVGYTDESITLFTNVYPYDIAAISAWTDLNVSAVVPSNAIAVIVKFAVTENVPHVLGFRKPGSENNLIALGASSSFVVGCSTSQIIQYYMESSTLEKIYIAGYVLSGVEITSSATQLIAGNGVWQEIDLSTVVDSEATMVLLEDNSQSDWGARKLFGTDPGDDTYYPARHTCLLIALDTNKKIHVKQPNTEQNIYLIGWATNRLITDFLASVVEGDAPLSVTFTDKTTGGTAPYTYTWDFGDGTEVSHEQNPTHIYGVEGYYTVKLTVTDSDSPVNEALETKTNYLLVRPPEVMVLLDRVNKSPAVGSWQTVDVSGNISIGMTGVLLEVINIGETQYEWGIRKKGSSDDIKSKIAPISHTWAMIGADDAKCFETYISNAEVQVWLVGFTRFGVQFLTNKVDKTPQLTDWQDVDCSADVEGNAANGLIFMVKNINADALRQYGVRKKGSTDAFAVGRPGYLNIAAGDVQFLLIGCDANQVCQFRGSVIADLKLYLIGYAWNGMEFSTDATEKSLTSYGSYTDVDCAALSAESAWAIVQVNCNDRGAQYAALRENGSSEDIYRPITYGAWKPQHLISHIFEGKVEGADVDFWVVGWVKQTALTNLTVYGWVKVGTNLIENAYVTCYSITKGAFVGMQQTDVNGGYSFINAGYEFEQFLISAHYDDGTNRWGLCKKLQLANE